MSNAHDVDSWSARMLVRWVYIEVLLIQNADAPLYPIRDTHRCIAYVRLGWSPLADFGVTGFRFGNGVAVVADVGGCCCC